MNARTLLQAAMLADDLSSAECHGFSRHVSPPERADLLALSDATCPPGPWHTTAEYTGAATVDVPPLPTADDICPLIRRMKRVQLADLSQIVAALATSVQYEAIDVTDRERKSLADALRDVCLLTEDFAS